MVGDLGLPQWYPEPGGIDAFQVGYRSNGNTGEDLSSEAPGQWHPAWLAVAANYFRDPYFIDLREADALRIGRQILRENALALFPQLKEKLWKQRGKLEPPAN